MLVGHNHGLEFEANGRNNFFNLNAHHALGLLYSQTKLS